MKRRLLAAIRISSVAAGLLLCGCAYSVTDESGARRVIGLMMVEYAPAKGNPTFAGQVIDVTSLGIGWHQHPSGDSIGVGYMRETLGYLRDNAVVLGDPLAARAYVREAVAQAANGSGGAGK